MQQLPGKARGPPRRITWRHCGVFVAGPTQSPGVGATSVNDTLDVAGNLASDASRTFEFDEANRLSVAEVSASPAHHVPGPRRYLCVQRVKAD